MRTKNPDRLPGIDSIAAGLLKGDEPLPVALAAWRTKHGLRLEDVSRMIGRQPSAVSSMLHNPARVPHVRRAVADLIGYPDVDAREG